MKTNVELAVQAGFVSAAYWPEEFKGLAGCVDRLLELHRAQVIEDLAAVDGGPVAFVKFKDGEVDWDTDDQILISNTSGDCMYPNIEWRGVYTDTQLAAHRAKDLAEIEAQEKQHIERLLRIETKVDALIAERDAMQARAAELEKTIEAHKCNWLAWQAKREALEADAGRYRAMRTASVKQDKAFIAELAKHDPRTADQFDAAIDAARAKDTPNE